MVVYAASYYNNSIPNNGLTCLASIINTFLRSRNEYDAYANCCVCKFSLNTQCVLFFFFFFEILSVIKVQIDLGDLRTSAYNIKTIYTRFFRRKLSFVGFFLSLSPHFVHTRTMIYPQNRFPSSKDARNPTIMRTTVVSK